MLLRKNEQYDFARINCKPYWTLWARKGIS